MQRHVLTHHPRVVVHCSKEGVEMVIEETTPIATIKQEHEDAIVEKPEIVEEPELTIKEEPIEGGEGDY